MRKSGLISVAIGSIVCCFCSGLLFNPIKLFIEPSVVDVPLELYAPARLRRAKYNNPQMTAAQEAAALKEFQAEEDQYCQSQYLDYFCGKPSAVHKTN